MNEVFVEVIDELDDSVLERGRDTEEVEDRQVLDVLAQAYSAGVGADGDVEFGGEEDDGEVLVDSGDGAGVELEDVDGVGLEKLLEDDAVLDVLAGGDADGSGFATHAGVAENVVGAGGLLHPPGVDGAELASAGDGFFDSPLLVGVDHEFVAPADLFTDNVAAAKVLCRVAAYFELE